MGQSDKVDENSSPLRKRIHVRQKNIKSFFKNVLKKHIWFFSHVFRKCLKILDFIFALFRKKYLTCFCLSRMPFLYFFVLVFLHIADMKCELWICAGFCHIRWWTSQGRGRHAAKWLPSPRNILSNWQIKQKLALFYERGYITDRKKFIFQRLKKSTEYSGTR